VLPLFSFLFTFCFRLPFVHPGANNLPRRINSNSRCCLLWQQQQSVAIVGVATYKLLNLLLPTLTVAVAMDVAFTLVLLLIFGTYSRVVKFVPGN